MHRSTPPPHRPRALSLGQRWVLWVLLQALLALTFAAGPRALIGPLHWHEGGFDHHASEGASGQVARHAHAAATDAVWLDQAAQATDDLNSSSAAAQAAELLWPVETELMERPRRMRAPWPLQGDDADWADALRAPPEVRPRG